MITDIAKYTDYPATKEQLDVIRQSVCKDLTNTEFYFFMNVCNSLRLNPFLKQVWCIKDRDGKVQIFTARDGYYANAERHKDFGGIQSCEVRKNDEFACNMVTGEVTHNIKDPLNRGDIMGAWAKVMRKGMPARVVFCSLVEYMKPSSNAWRNNPAQMIMKCAEAAALKKQFPLPGVQNEYEWEIRNNVATPLHMDSQFMSEEQRKELYGLVSSLSLGPDEIEEHYGYVSKAITLGDYKDLKATLTDLQFDPIDRVRNGETVSQKEITQAVKARL